MSVAGPTTIGGQAKGRTYRLSVLGSLSLVDGATGVVLGELAERALRVRLRYFERRADPAFLEVTGGGTPETRRAPERFGQAD